MIKTKHKLFIIIFIIVSLILFTVITIYCYRKQSYNYTQTSLYLSNKKFIMQNTDILLNNYMKGYETSNNENNFKVREIGKALLYGMRSNFMAEPPNPEKFPSSEQLIANYYDTETSIYCAYLVNLAYSLNTNIVYDNQNNHKIAISFLSNELIKTTKVAFRIVDLLSYHCTLSDSYSGFIIEFLYPKPIIIIALRGSVNKCEWYEDAKVIFKTPSWAHGIIKVHSGLNNIYMNTDWLNNDSTTVSIRLILAKYFGTGRAYNSDPQNIQPKTLFNTAKIIITGHSLGGGISNLITADMALNFQDLRNISKIYTFAAPYTGNQDFANLIDKNVKNNYSGLFQIINTTDIVPTVGALYYVRPKYQLFCFTGGSNIDYNPLNAHYMQTYMTGVKMNKLYFNVAKDSNQTHFCGLDLGVNLNQIDVLSNPLLCK